MSPMEMIDQMLREQCVFEAVKGQSKSHWFNYMVVLEEKCITQRIDPLNARNATLMKITQECHD